MDKRRPSYATEKRLWVYAGLIAGLGLGLALLLWRAQPGPADTAIASAVPQQNLQVALQDLSLSLITYQITHDLADFDRLKSADTQALSLAGRIRVRGLDSNRVSRAVKSLGQAANVSIRAEGTVSEALASFVSSLSQVDRMMDQRLSEVRRLSGRQHVLVQARGLSSEMARDLAMYLRSRQAEQLSAFRRSEQTLLKLLDGYPTERATAQWTGQVRALLGQASSAARQTLEADKERETGLREFIRGQSDLSLLLNIASTDSAATRPRRWASAEGVMAAAAVATAALLTVVLLMISFVRRELLSPLGTLAAIADSAAAGDLTRQFRMRKWNEVGTVALAVNRLISVMARSENLIYHLATLIETSGEAIVSHTLDGTILSWNRGAQRLYGYSAEEIKGSSIEQLWPEGQAESFANLLEAIRTGGKIKPFEIAQRGKNGRSVNVLMRVASIFDSTRQVIGASICLQELSKTAPLQAPRLAA